MTIHPSTATKTFWWSSVISVFFWTIAFAQIDDRGHARPYVIYAAWIASCVFSFSTLWLVIYTAVRAARVHDKP